MPENFEIIRARIKDDTAVLIDRLLRAKQKNVVLILPKNSIISANLESLKLLKQETDSVGKNLYIDTESGDFKAFAKSINIALYNPDLFVIKKIKQNESINTYGNNVKKMFDILPPSPKPLKKDEEPIVEEPIISEIKSAPAILENNNSLEENLEDFYSDFNKKIVKNSLFTKKGIFSFKFLVFTFIFSGLALLFLALYLALPKADIQISLKKIPIKATLSVAVSKNISSPNFSSNIIPGQYFLLSKSGSKTINIQDADETLLKSGGYVFIYNAYSSVPQKLIAQTRFETKEGKIFRLQKAIIVPGAKMIANKLTPSSIKADVVADISGEEYNIGPSYFTIPGFKGSPKYAGFYAKSTEPMIGKKFGLGAEFTNDELEKTKKELQSELAKELENETLDTLKNSSDLKLIEGASNVKIDEFQFLPPKITMKITWQAILFREKDLKALIENFVFSKYQGLDNLNFSNMIQRPKASKSDFKKGELFFTLDIDKENLPLVDLNALKRELSGRNENEIRSLISEKYFISSATISLWPFWVKRAPENINKIKITLDNK